MEGDGSFVMAREDDRDGNGLSRIRARRFAPDGTPAPGDVIVEIAGQAITNIYDYTYALDLLKIGQGVKVVYMRGSERRETTLTPAARR